MREVPEEAIEEAEGDPVTQSHSHVAVTAADGSLAEHLATDHGLDVHRTVSPATAEGLHDRVHDETKAADD